jgi:hypothetical protein
MTTSLRRPARPSRTVRHAAAHASAAPSFTASARRLGIASALGVVCLSAAYAGVLVAGLLSLPSPSQPIGDPLFAVLEILILLVMPCMVSLMVAVHAWAPAEMKVFGVLAVIFVSLAAVVTCGVHLVLLTVGRQAAFTGQPWASALLSFTWPSVAYALDVLAWDGFFAVAAIAAAMAVGGTRRTAWIRALLLASGVLSLAGLSGVIAGDMRLRNVGIVGYAGVFPVAALLLALLFRRTPPRVA